MIHEIVFDPTDLRSFGSAFDDAWDAILTQCPEPPDRPELRLRLASLVLQLARDRQLDQQEIKATAVRLLTEEYLVWTLPPDRVAAGAS